MTELETQTLHDALDRIARTPDGRILYLFLQQKRMEVFDPPTDGALRLNLGERTFASKLMSLMGKGISESGGRTSSSSDTSGSTGEPLVVFAAPKPVDASQSRGTNRRIGPDTRVPGWDRPEPAGR